MMAESGAETANWIRFLQYEALKESQLWVCFADCHG